MGQQVKEDPEKKNGVPNLTLMRPTWTTIEGGNIPRNAIQGGWEADGKPLYVARGYFYDVNAHTSGKAGLHLPGFCRIPNNYNEYTFPSYDVLVADPGTYKWVPHSPGKVISASGIRAENQTLAKPIIVTPTYPDWGPLFVIRTYYEDALIPGHAGRDKAWIGLNSQTVAVSSMMCEVLCYAD